MFNNKKITAFLTLSALVPLLCACDGGILSDTGTDITVQKDITDYLDVSVLDNVQTDEAFSDTYTLTKGTFSKPGLESTYSRDYYTTYPVRAKVEYGTMTYVSTEVYNYQPVTKGTVIAWVETEINPLDLQQARLRLQRITERYEEEKQNHEKQVAKDKEDLALTVDKYDHKSKVALMARSDLEWQNTCRDYEKQIADQQKIVKQMEAYSTDSFKAIVADRDGQVILPSSRIRTGDTIDNGRLICSIISLDELIISASNNNFHTYRYGMDFTWNVNFTGAEAMEMTGSVVNGTSGDLYGNLRRDNIYFLLQPEDKEAFSEVKTKVRDAKIYGASETMENVLLVPIKAVTVENDITYVTVVKEDGTFLKTGFKAGGVNGTHYWVLDGLEEGTVILAEP